MLYLEVELLEDFTPARLLADWFGGTTQPSEGSMVGTNQKLSAEQVLFEVFDIVDYGQKFSTGATVVALRLGQQPGRVTYHPFLSVLDLRQHSSDATIAGIRVKDELVFVCGHCQNRSARKCILEYFKRFGALCVPLEVNVLASQRV
jgi:hypothetical protein